MDRVRLQRHSEYVAAKADMSWAFRGSARRWVFSACTMALRPLSCSSPPSRNSVRRRTVRLLPYWILELCESGFANYLER